MSKKKAATKAAKAKGGKTAKKATPTTKMAPPPPPKIRKSTTPKNKNSQSYTLGEVYENIRAFCGLNKRSQAKEFCEDIALFVKDSLGKGYKIPFFGLGKMYVRRTKPRTGRNPATGEMIQIPSKKRVRFSVSKALKDAVL